jgi:hypothetical protein
MNEMTMFDLYPEVEHLMLDLPATRAGRMATEPPPPDGSHAPRPLARVRYAIGRQLILIGSALAVDERRAGRSAGR